MTKKNASPWCRYKGSSIYVCRCRCFKFFVSLQVLYFNGSVNKHDSNNEGLQRPKGMAAVLRRVARVLLRLRGVQHHETSRNFGSQICPPAREIQLSRAAWAAFQRRGSILAWIVILSDYGADTIAEVKLLITPFLRWSLDLWNQLLGF